MIENIFLKCHYHFHPLAKFERGVVDQKVEDNNLDIFEMTFSTKPITDLINKELLIFRCYQVDVKNIKFPLQWWEKYM
jgi:hypothetical protein